MAPGARRPADPFGVDALRTTIVESWASSVTRLREDAAAEADLGLVGYRDRLFTELVANAADAAHSADSPGRVAVWLDGRRLHVANTGSPLTTAGVRSLTALRVSAKGNEQEPGVVGRFGVGFSAVVGVADHVEIRSVSGSVLFDRTRSHDVVAELGLDEELHGAGVPLLRLAWPVDTEPAHGYATEVVLTLQENVDVDVLVADMVDQAGDRLLELTALQQISIGDREVHITRRVTEDGRSESARLQHVVDGAETREQEWLIVHGRSASWMVERDGASVVRRGSDVLRAPTPTGITLTVPARCVARIDLTPDRRQLHPDADIDSVADGYADLVALLDPAERSRLIPGAGLADNPVDARVTAAVLDELTRRMWVHTADGSDVAPPRAVLFPDLTDDLGAVLGDVVDGLVCPGLAQRRRVSAMARTGVRVIGLADVAAALTGVDRPARWWGRLYEALSVHVAGTVEAEELGALPVPRADGRMNIGARGLLLPIRPDLTVSWIHTPAIEAVHPLLERLGAQSISISEMIADTALRSLIESDELDDDDASRLAEEVLELIAADEGVGVPEWMGQILLLDRDGELTPADEMLLPGGALAEVLVDDAPFATVADALVDRFGREALRRIGVGDGFSLLIDDMPVAADHDLDAEDQWWDGFDVPPDRLVAVRDLDLVDETRWVQALHLMAADERIVEALADRAGYTAWWLRRHAVIDGRCLGWYRSPDDETTVGVLDPLPHPSAGLFAAALGGGIDDAEDAQTLLDHLADPDREVKPGVASVVTSRIIAAIKSGVVDVADIVVPQGCRALDGSVSDSAVVVDRPWYLGVVPADRAVVPGSPIDADGAEVLADVLDIPTASEAYRVEVISVGEPATGADVDAVIFAAESGRRVVQGSVIVHDDLIVECVVDDGDPVRRSVRWWVSGDTTHLRRHSSGG